MTALTVYTCSVPTYNDYLACYKAAVERRLARTLKLTGSFQALNQIDLDFERNAKNNAVAWYDHFAQQLVGMVRDVESGRVKLATIRDLVEQTLAQIDQQMRSLAAPPVAKKKPDVLIPRKTTRFDPMVLSMATATQVRLAKTTRRGVRV